MKDFEYMDPTFSIENNPYFDNIDGLKDISDYLDFAIKSTIYKQMPNVTEEKEQEFASIILKNYMAGDTAAFTSQYGIRNNINKIGHEKIKFLLLKTLMEKKEQNIRILHKIRTENFADECADYIVDIGYYGQIDENEEWIQKNIPTFIDVYVEENYKKPYDVKVRMEQICYENSTTAKALEQLNLQMSLNRIKR